ncbi:MAG: HD domain-containing protein [Candidatus Caldarchaeales archaeon]
MSWPEFVEPGYPVFRAYIIPRAIDGRIEPVRRVTAEDVERWGRTLDELKRFLSMVNGFASRSANGLSLHERLELIADCFTAFFRTPLMREVLPSVAPSPLKSYLLARLLWKLLAPEWFEDPLEFCKYCYGEQLGAVKRSKVFSVLENPEVNSLVESAWFDFPADTRPGANTSSLLSHMLLTSSMVWALAVKSGRSREEAALIRLAAMLHDMGKPFNYREHYRVSPTVAERLLTGLLPEDELRRVVDAVKRHHAADSEVREADRRSSGIDRLRGYVEATIMNEIRRLSSELGLDPGIAYGSGAPAWGFWIELEQKRRGAVESLSRSFVENFTRGGVRVEVGHELWDDMLLCMIDVGGIQDFITRGSELRTVSASSVVIDVAVSAHIPLAIQRLLESKSGVWVPLESFLYTSGGVVTLLLPRGLKSNLMEAVEDLKKWYRRVRLKLYAGCAELSSDYRETTARLQSAVAMAKLEEDFSFSPVELNAVSLCEVCRTENSVTTLETGEMVCQVCKDLYEIGNDLHFGTKWDSEVTFRRETFKVSEAFGGLSWKDVSPGIIELIAGHSVDDLKALGLLRSAETSGQVARRPPRLRNIGLIKVDGNLMGEFFAESVSISDALERSARVDMALKRALQEAIEAAADAIDDSTERLRFVALMHLGLMYVGGDDALLFCPSWVALPLANSMGLAFHREMGAKASLSVGVVAAPSKHDVWALIEAASRLLQEAKRKGRTIKAGAVCFDVVEAGIISGPSAKERQDSMRARRITAQPLALDEQQGEISLGQLFQLLSKHSGLQLDEFRMSYIASRDEPNGVSNDFSKQLKDALKEVRAAIRRTVQVGEALGAGRDWQLYGTLFALKMSDQRGGYGLVRDLIDLWSKAGSGDIGIPVADVDLMIKFMGGGEL